ncbi:MAG: cyclic nucleotide-binding domain-containing protein [Rhodothermaceae bacterium]|nr:cyclic nucleotide-binding domain-containing protein [Rhodothermaceae bacterium]
MLTADDFRIVDVFADQDEEDLAWLASVAEERTLAEGERIFEPGAPAVEMLVQLEGAFQIFTLNKGQRMLFGTIRPGNISGLLPFSRMETFQGEGIAPEPSRVALIHKDYFWEMLTRMPEVGQRLVARMTDRVRESSRQDQQREKMMALGKLSAGLAHELNNPAAAVRRSVSDLRERLQMMPKLVTSLTGHGLTPDQVEAARGALMTCTAAVPGTVSALERGEREDELADWLEDHDVPHAYIVAEVLADEGVTPKALTHMAEHVHEDALSDVVLWIEKGMAAERLLAEIESAAARISDLVASIKSYSHMDQSADRQHVDIHHGIDSTLTMLGHSIKKKQAQIIRDYSDELPEVCAYPGEINQVWTNLLDNAIDAIDEGGTIRIATRCEGEIVCINIVDDGSGIPADVQARIFDPFFTTKDPGQGTGLGLDIAQRIVKQHQGKINLTSEPGRTDFEVCLPVDAPKRPAALPPQEAAETLT